MPKHGRPSSRSRDDFLFNNPISAPYGTMFSKPLNVKIVGGKYVSSFESLTDLEPGMINTHRSISDPSTQHNRISSHSTNAKDMGGLYDQPGDGSFSRHRVLPAIGNTYTTGLKGSLIENPVDIGDLYNRLPRDIIVSAEPLPLTEDEELAVMCEIRRELQYFENSLLDKVFTDLRRIDRKSTGYLPFQDLQLVLSANRILLPPRLLRLMGSIFVSRVEQGTINYNRLLNFVSDALKGGAPPVNEQSNENKERGDYEAMASERSPRNQHEVNHDDNFLASSSSPTAYYQTKREDWRQTSSPTLPRADAYRTLRHLQDRIPFNMNIERLRHAFQRADRHHRGTLSELQIREICSECLPLDREVVDLLVSHVPARGGGQYNWQSFIDLLERVQPVPTGLRIPESKRPLEYARSILQPATSWPAPDVSPLQQSEEPPSNETALRFRIQSPSLPHAQPQDALPSMLRREDSFRSADLNAYSTAPNYIESSGVIRPMEAMYPNPVDVASEPWHNRFMKFVDAIYRQDQNCSGFVNENVLKILTREFNSTCHLNIDDGSLALALSRNRKSNGIHVHGFLMSLANVH